jgi:hypothetical protein
MDDPKRLIGFGPFVAGINATELMAVSLVEIDGYELENFNNYYFKRV